MPSEAQYICAQYICICSAGIRFIAKPEGGGEGQGYVACTTDRLLADKADTWDVYIDDTGGLKVG